MTDFRQDFLEFALARDVLRFGDLRDQGGRGKTPYFFNAGLFNDGESLRRLGDFYARAYLTSGVRMRPAVRSSLQGHNAGRGDGHRVGRKRAQSAVQLQPQRGRRITAKAGLLSARRLRGGC